MKKTSAAPTSTQMVSTDEKVPMFVTIPSFSDFGGGKQKGAKRAACSFSAIAAARAPGPGALALIY
jgi:hypothetical protein